MRPDPDQAPDSDRVEFSALIDGQPVDGPAPCLADRGWHYGDGLFETVAVVDGHPCHWRAHLRRMEAGSRRLGLPLPDPRTLTTEAARLCSGSGDAILKVIWTAGDGRRGYRRPDPVRPRRILQRFAWHRPQGVERWRLQQCRHRCGDNGTLAGVKHLNRLDQVMARAEWGDAPRTEGVMLAQDGRVLCGTMSNLFVQRGDRLATPALTTGGVEGVVRGLIIDCAARRRAPVAIGTLWPAALHEADAVFLCNALIGVVRVARFEQTGFDPAIVPHPAFVDAAELCHRPDPGWHP